MSTSGKSNNKITSFFKPVILESGEDNQENSSTHANNVPQETD